MSTILLVEDDAALRDGLTELFTREGYSVTTAANAAEARQNFSVYIDLIILDVTLPDGNGVSLCQEWRDQGITTSILFLTAKDEEFDVVRGLDAGGNDYVTKPFRMMELLSRIRALLRRAGGEMRVDDTLRFEDLALEPGTFQLSCGERAVRLSRREYDLMESLMRSGRQILTKEQLLVKVWGYDSDAEDNNVEVYISFLRRKLTHLHSRVKIRTQRMVGYCLEVEG